MADEDSRVAAHRHRCPGHAELLLAVDAELGPVDAEACDVALDALAWRLMPADPDPRADLRAVAGLAAAAGAPRAGAGRRGSGFPAPLRVAATGTLRLEAALGGASAHPLVVAAAMAEAARRAGIHAGVVAGGGRAFVAHRHLREALVVDPAAPADGPVLAHDRARGRDLRWSCAHQVACLVLDAVVEDAQRRGDLGRAVRAAELRLDLPFDDAALQRRSDEVARVRARLN